ncbi:hypothetical protein AVEN_161338-1, partial [Araneus ventricosus]
QGKLIFHSSKKEKKKTDQEIEGADDFKGRCQLSTEKLSLFSANRRYLADHGAQVAVYQRPLVTGELMMRDIYGTYGWGWGFSNRPELHGTPGAEQFSFGERKKK